MDHFLYNFLYLNFIKMEEIETNYKYNRIKLVEWMKRVYQTD